MKQSKIIAAVTALATFVALFAAFSVSADMVTVYERKDNIAKNQPYTASLPYTADPALSPYQDIDGKELTDGELYGGNIYASCFHGFDYRLESPMYATVDLGAAAEGLIEFRMQFINYADSGIDAPSSLDYFVSDDGVNFTPLGSGKAENSERVTFYRLKLKEPVSGRYVKALIGKPKSGVFVFCSEFEVYNSKAVLKDESELSEESQNDEESEENVPVLVDKTENLDTEKYPLSFIEGGRFQIAGGVLKGVKPGDTPAVILANLKTAAGVKVLKPDGGELTKGEVYSGCRLVLFSGGKAKSDYAVIIPGDTDGVPGIAGGDAKALRRAILEGKSPAQSPVYSAGDIDQNGVLGVTDYIALQLHLAKKVDLFKDYTDMIPKRDMKIKYTSPTLYTLTCTASDGKAMSLTFDKKTWGTWNIGTLTVGGVSLAGGGTDWEYVYRAAENAGGWVWSGGNHGNEILTEIKFYDKAVGKELIFDKVGATLPVENLVIVEKTKLHWGNETKTFCDVVRTYTVVGEKISLDVSYDFTRDCYFALSYTCMFPVPKTVGLYIDFFNDDGTVRTVETLKVGAADYSGVSYKNNAAPVCRIYGYQHTKYSFLVSVFTKEDSLGNFKGPDKTFYWDMNATQNKLYYSKFSGESALTKVQSGTRWETSCSWELLIGDEK